MTQAFIPVQPLSTQQHNRDVLGLTYVYPVISRRAGGVSIGINLNPNNACNWHCIYCQVPNLQRGNAPIINLQQLKLELDGLLDQVLNGDFMQLHVPEDARRICDIALSGNGEPTSAVEFAEVIDLIGEAKKKFNLPEDLPIRLITNGSLINREEVQAGLRKLAALQGEVWFKVDAAEIDQIQLINGVKLKPNSIAARLKLCASIAPTWVQTCMFKIDGRVPDAQVLSSYACLLKEAGPERLQGVLLYGLARPSLQEGAQRLAALNADEIEACAKQIRAETGLVVKVSQ